MYTHPILGMVCGAPASYLCGSYFVTALDKIRNPE